MTLDRIMLRGTFEHERLKPAIIRTNQEEAGYPITHHKINMNSPLIRHADQSQRV